MKIYVALRHSLHREHLPLQTHRSRLLCSILLNKALNIIQRELFSTGVGICLQAAYCISILKSPFLWPLFFLSQGAREMPEINLQESVFRACSLFQSMRNVFMSTLNHMVMARLYINHITNRCEPVYTSQ